MRRGGANNPVSLFAFQDIITAVMGIILLLVLLLSLCLVQLPEDVGSGVMDEEIMEADAELTSLKDQLKKLTSEIKQETSDASLMSVASLKSEIANSQNVIKGLEDSSSEIQQKIADNTSRQQNLQQELKQRQPDIEKIERLEKQIDKNRNELSKIKKDNRRYYNFANNQKLPWIIDLREDMFLISKANSKQTPVVFNQTNSRAQALLNWIKNKGIQNDYFLIVARKKTVPAFRKIKTFVEDAGADIGVELVGENVKLLQEGGVPK